MKIISSVLLLLVVSYSSFAQFDAKTVGALSPKEAYRNIKVIPLHSDTNSSVYLIFIKQAVKKHLHAYHTELQRFKANCMGSQRIARIHNELQGGSQQIAWARTEFQ